MPVRALLLAAALALPACDAPEPAAPVSPPPEPGAVASGGKPSTDAAIDAAAVDNDAAAPPAALAGQVWRVQESTAVEPGTTYAFLEGGTLVIDAPQGTPLYGQWEHRDGALNLTEEGVSYRTEVVEASDRRLHLRSHNPGEPVEIVLVPAPDVPLPPAQPPSDADAGAP